jgi:hypothetical protein
MFSVDTATPRSVSPRGPSVLARTGSLPTEVSEEQWADREDGTTDLIWGVAEAHGAALQGWHAPASL